MEEFIMNLITTATGVALALTLGLTQLSGASAQTKIINENYQENVRTIQFVDNDNYGICDNRENNNVGNVGGINYIDNDNDGVCDNRVNNSNFGNGNRNNFVDNDNDGVCDNREIQGNGNCGKGGNVNKAYCRGKNCR